MFKKPDFLKFFMPIYYCMYKIQRIIYKIYIKFQIIQSNVYMCSLSRMHSSVKKYLTFLDHVNYVYSMYSLH